MKEKVTFLFTPASYLRMAADEVGERAQIVDAELVHHLDQALVPNVVAVRKRKKISNDLIRFPDIGA